MATLFQCWALLVKKNCVKSVDFAQERGENGIPSRSATIDV